MNSNKKKFGKKVRELRKSKGLTQEQLAEIIGMETPNISKMETGLHFPQFENLNKLSKALGVEMIELFNFGHFKNKEELISEIIKYLKEHDIKKTELVYKFIKNIDELYA